MKTYDRIKIILENRPETRNSDKRLIWYFWMEEGLATSFQMFYADFAKATSPESIRRARQKIQQLHPELGPTSELIKKRRGVKSATKGTFVYREDNGQGVFI